MLSIISYYKKNNISLKIYWFSLYWAQESRNWFIFQQIRAASRHSWSAVQPRRCRRCPAGSWAELQGPQPAQQRWGVRRYHLIPSVPALCYLQHWLTKTGFTGCRHIWRLTCIICMYNSTSSLTKCWNDKTTLTHKPIKLSLTSVKDSALSIWSKGSEGTNCDIFSIIMISNFPCHGACIDNLSLLKDRPDSHWCPDSLRQYLWPLLSCCWQPDPQAESPGGRRISERAGHWSEYQAVHYGLYFCLRLTRTRRSMLAVWRQGWDWLKVTRSVRYELRSSDRSWLEPVS